MVRFRPATGGGKCRAEGDSEEQSRGPYNLDVRNMAQNYSQSILSRLVEALLAVGETNEADQLCKKYGKIWLYWKLKCLDIRLSSILFRD